MILQKPLVAEMLLGVNLFYTFHNGSLYTHHLHIAYILCYNVNHVRTFHTYYPSNFLASTSNLRTQRIRQ